MSFIKKLSEQMPKCETARVAIAESAPVSHQKQASHAKALEILQKASKQGVQLVAFGETWLPGYPAWLDVCPDAAVWDHEPTKRVFARLRQNSVSVPGPEVQTLCQAAGGLKLTVVIGLNQQVKSGP